ncbi:MAG: hypothetical protein Ct9H300mP27_03630 [Chloroflexota bacterium]|nr:MAG: hypothetical protein Ct9H300mP27_03630 [Chloroflexota bacterium]
MIYQLRTYTVNKGMMDDWVSLFNDKIIAIQENYGIKVEAAWVNLDRNQFIWIRSLQTRTMLKPRKQHSMLHRNGTQSWITLEVT